MGNNVNQGGTNQGSRSNEERRSKFLSLHDLQLSTSPHVFVINASAQRDMQGEINIPIVTSRGQTLNVQIFQSWIPQDLSLQVPKEELLQNPYFSSMVAKQLVTIVTDDWAKQELNTKDGREEYDRLSRLLRGETRDSRSLAEVEGEDDDPENKITPLVVEVMHRDDLADGERKSMLRNNKHRLTARDYAYIIQQSTNNQLTSWANEELLALKTKD